MLMSCDMKQEAMTKRVCGLDEAGRGALAGPLVAAAVILPCTVRIISRRSKIKIRDSKLLSAQQRNIIYKTLKKLHIDITIEVISARTINNHGIGWANRQVFRRLIKKIDADEFIVDGNLKIGRICEKTDRIRSIVNADATIAEVMLAGIVAKVQRDKLMRLLHHQFPKYHWKRNVGYGTVQHIKAIRQYNVTYYHRNIFVTTAMRKPEEELLK